MRSTDKSRSGTDSLASSVPAVARLNDAAGDGDASAEATPPTDDPADSSRSDRLSGAAEAATLFSAGATACCVGTVDFLTGALVI
jgi:hypothetical protein